MAAVSRIFNLSVHNFEQLSMFALTLIGECMLKELVILGNELKLSQAIPDTTTPWRRLRKFRRSRSRTSPPGAGPAWSVLHA